MSIELSSGVKLFEIGKDSRGFVQFVDEDGVLYTKQGNAIVKSGTATSFDQLEAIVGRLEEKGDEGSALLVKKLVKQFKASLVPQEAFETPVVSDFITQARTDADVFFSPDFALLDKKLALAEAIAKENKDTAISRADEDSSVFQVVEDRGFARKLAKAQGKFAGQGIATSGIRLEAIEQESQDRDVEKDERLKEFTRFIEDKKVGFDQFLKKQDIEKQVETRRLDVASEAKALTTAETRRQEKQLQNEELAKPFDELADSFMSNKLNA